MAKRKKSRPITPNKIITGSASLHTIHVSKLTAQRLRHTGISGESMERVIARLLDGAEKKGKKVG